MARKSALRRNPCPGLATVHYTVSIPDAHEVVLTGDFTGWVTDEVLLTEGPCGQWHTTLLLAPGEYQYRLLVDGCWTDPPGDVPRIPNEFGSCNGILCVPAPPP